MELVKNPIKLLKSPECWNGVYILTISLLFPAMSPDFIKGCSLVLWRNEFDYTRRNWFKGYGYDVVAVL